MKIALKLFLLLGLTLSFTAGADTIVKIDKWALRKAITSYYETTGIWAGTFEIAGIEEIRIDGAVGTNNYVREVHVRYRYVPLAGVARDAGKDERIFMIDFSKSPYQVLFMGGHMSATF